MTCKPMAAAMSALALVAGGLVSAAVIGVVPARADHCDPADQGGRQSQQDDQAQPRQNGQDDQAPQPDGQGQGGALAPPTPTPDPDGDRSPAPRRTRAQDPAQTPTESPAQDPRQDPTANPPQDPGQDPTANPPQDPGQEPTRERAATPTRSASPSPSPTGAADEECADLGPFVEDFIDIRRVRPNFGDVRPGRNGSRGSFVSACGTNRNGHNNPDNFIVAPGVRNGAHHLHDYVGNLSTDAFSTDQSLAAAGTTCRFGDRSTYFWPVLRDRKVDDNLGDQDGNVGRVLRPRSVTLQFRGNPVSRVTAMPRFLRLITGDAKAATNGGANARAQWSCTGFTNRVTTQYPLCPRFSQVVRILDFPSCWDGQNTDSANHRTHVVFPGQGGACPQGTRAVPQLRMILTYTVPQGPSYALDAFPEQRHNPVTDHADFANVMPDRLMAFAVGCINRGRRC